MSRADKKIRMEKSAVIWKLDCKQSLMKVVSSNLTSPNFFNSLIIDYNFTNWILENHYRLLQGRQKNSTDFKCIFMPLNMTRVFELSPLKMGCKQKRLGDSIYGWNSSCQYRRPSLYAVFLSANLYICDWKMAFFLEPIL